MCVAERRLPGPNAPSGGAWLASGALPPLGVAPPPGALLPLQSARRLSSKTQATEYLFSPRPFFIEISLVRLFFKLFSKLWGHVRPLRCALASGWSLGEQPLQRPAASARCDDEDGEQRAQFEGAQRHYAHCAQAQ